MSPGALRVIHVAGGREWRGGQRQVFLLARELAARDVDQIVITSRDSRLAQELTSAGVAVRAVDWRRGLSVGAMVATLRAAQAGPAILHAHDAHALVIAGLAAPLTRNRLIATRRVTFPIRRPGFWARADRIIAISEAVKRELVGSDIPAARVTVVHSGIDVEATRRTTGGDAFLNQLGLPVGRLAVSVAALDAHKDHPTLLRAAAALRPDHPDLHWALAGTGPHRDQFGALARDLGLTSVIHFLGEIPDPLPLIGAANCFVSSTIAEGLGTSILDAMALGIPVVATDVGGVRELLEGGAGILTPAGNPAALAAGVAQVLAQPSVVRGLRDRATARLADFTAGGMAEGVLAVYRSLVLER